MINSNKRDECPNCLRAKKACICHCVDAMLPSFEIGIFQHPSEQKQTKGTARLAALSMENAKLWVGELISECVLSVKDGHSIESKAQAPNDNLDSLEKWIAQKPTFLLYPETDDVLLTAGACAPERQVWGISEIAKLNGNFRVLVLDGTWRKTHKMLMLNPQLQVLPRIAISPNKTSSYQIRKQKNNQSLATIEAIAELLNTLEPKSDHSEKLHQVFDKMQKFLLSLRVNSVTSKHVHKEEP